MSYEYVDAKGTRLEKGQRVRFVDDETGCGHIESISDPDGDMQDGYAIQLPPTVTVRFDDGDADCYPMEWLGKWHDDSAPFECGDIVVTQ